MNNTFRDKSLFIFIILLLLIQIFYFIIYFFTSGIYFQYGYILSDLTIGIILLSIIFLHSMILISLILIYFGYKNKSPWMRKFTIFYLTWGILWGLWGIFIDNNILLHLLIILFYIISFYYLTTEKVKKYFNIICKYGNYILYTRNVELKSGKKLPIFFFSSHPPKSGYPSTMPEGYTIKENLKSHMPYLKKTDHIKKPENTILKLKKNIKKIEVIYVVNHLQPGKNRGNWAVRNKNKIFSSHRTKKTAIKKARIIAKKRDSRVLVQNTNGRFSYGFNPKTE